jgi:predicted DNA-binding transcriptional regulator YafY
MASNKNALIRYKTIDKCLQNRYRKCTLNDLIDACSDALYEYEGKQTNVSKRTIQLDIQTMRSDKLGYNAPIMVVDKKYYTYEDPKYSIMNLPISSQDLEKLSETVSFLSQFKGFSHFNQLQEVIQKLEDHIYAEQTKNQPVIDFEKNENLKGIHFLDELHKYIINKKTIRITYQSFKTRNPNTFDFSPYLLKEFRNRWFVIGRRKANRPLENLALDRIINIQKNDNSFTPNNIDLEAYYKVAIGVTINPNLKTQKIQLFVSHKFAPYIETKPLHFSQKTIERKYFGIIIQLDVQHNFELEKDILAFGEEVRVISPPELKRKIYNRLKKAVEFYDTDIQLNKIADFINKLAYKGCVVINYIFSKREIKKIANDINQLIRENGSIEAFDLTADPISYNLSENQNIQKIIEKLPGNKQIKQVMFYPNATESTHKWHQNFNDDSIAIRVFLSAKNEEKIRYKVHLGSHHKALKKQTIDETTEISKAENCIIKNGGIMMVNSKLLQKNMGIESKRNAYIEILLA